CKQELLGNTQ
ncbi:putative transmembrane domain protein, partial [Chlamydia psittaci 06-1683]